MHDFNNVCMRCLLCSQDMTIEGLLPGSLEHVTLGRYCVVCPTMSLMNGTVP